MLPKGRGPEFLIWMMTQPGPDGTANWQKLVLDIPLHSKERPRLGKNGIAYTTTAYKKWTAQAVEILKKQWNGSPPLEFALYCVELHGSARGDVDNLEGAVLDAAVKAGVFQNDTCRRLPAHVALWQPSDIPQIVLWVRPWWPLK